MGWGIKKPTVRLGRDALKQAIQSYVDGTRDGIWETAATNRLMLFVV
jgi:hypothetical protein